MALSFGWVDVGFNGVPEFRSETSFGYRRADQRVKQLPRRALANAQEFPQELTHYINEAILIEREQKRVATSARISVLRLPVPQERWADAAKADAERACEHDNFKFLKTRLHQ
ncbi:hypothetical protein AB4Y38_24385 [Paraburkholderia sp. EG285A]|uniref:hypothetical protein n=1 Tax=Paraburkholderia sp. EG285A TaxID=3237009 RepID=UPI0034D2F45D